MKQGWRDFLACSSSCSLETAKPFLPGMTFIPGSYRYFLKSKRFTCIFVLFGFEVSSGDVLPEYRATLSPPALLPLPAVNLLSSKADAEKSMDGRLGDSF